MVCFFYEWVKCCLQFSVMSADEADVNLTRLSSFDEYCNEPLSGTALPVTTENTPPLRTADGLPPIDTATRVINIPHLPSASARWKSQEVTRIFVFVMMSSTLLLVLSTLLLLVIVGLPGVLASILGIVLASMKLFECCESELLQTNVTVVRASMTFCSKSNQLFVWII